MDKSISGVMSALEMLEKKYRLAYIPDERERIRVEDITTGKVVSGENLSAERIRQ